MPVRFVRGDIFQSGADVLVNPVNCVGVMGAGLALEFRKRFPGLYEDYRAACQRGMIAPGEVVRWGSDTKPDIVLFPVKVHWKRPSRLPWIGAGLRSLRKLILEDQITSIAVPALGCGLDGLNWDDVKPLIDIHLGDLDADVLVYESHERSGGNVRTERFAFSNFQPAPIRHNGIIYPTVEHFYVAMKTTDVQERRRIAALPRAADAKRAGRRLKLRPDWDELKDKVMWYALRQKFAPGTSHAQRLLATGDEEIVEWNTWHDRYWGRCTCARCGGAGRNRLGEMLMKLREELRQKTANTTAA